MRGCTQTVRMRFANPASTAARCFRGQIVDDSLRTRTVPSSPAMISRMLLVHVLHRVVGSSSEAASREGQVSLKLVCTATRDVRVTCASWDSSAAASRLHKLCAATLIHRPLQRYGGLSGGEV